MLLEFKNPGSRLNAWAARRPVLIGLALAAWAGALTAAGATFVASIDRDTITLGDSARFTLNFEGGSPRSLPAMPAIPNLIVNYVGPESQMSFINGEMSSSTKHHYNITPRAVGEYVIPALTVEVGGQNLTSQAIRVRVVKDASTGNVAGTEGQLAFMKLVLPRTEVYVGEAVPAEIDLYLNNMVRDASSSSLQIKAEGFAVGKTAQGQERAVRVGNTEFRQVPFLAPMTAAKSGELRIEAVDCLLTLQLPAANNRHRDVFDAFSMLQRGETKRIIVSTEPATVLVLPLPTENVPPGFNGAVGSYSMVMSVTPTNLAVGDPLTVKIQISGRGALDTLALPAQAGWQDFKSYQPTSKIETTHPLGLQGTKTFDVVLVPQKADLAELPPLKFSYFDPEQKAYRTLTEPGVPLIVRPAGSATLPAVPAAVAGPPPVAQDIVSIKQRLGPGGGFQRPWVEQPWFLAVQGVPLMAWAGMLLLRKQRETLANNPRLRRQRQVDQLVRDGLVELQAIAAANDSEAFFATLVRLLQEQIGERLHVPASAITEAVVEEQLRPRGVPDATLTSLRELFQACNLARYAPVKSAQALAAFIPKLEAVLKELQQHPSE